MKRLLIGSALAALWLPSAAAAQVAADHDHECLDEACVVQSLFDVGSGGGSGALTGVDAPRYGTWGFDLEGRDLSVAPGDDFFRHANGTAVDALVIPGDRTRYGSFDVLRELSDARLMAIVQGLTARTDLAAGSDEAKIAALYTSYMDTARIEALDAQPIQPYLDEIRAAGDHAAFAALMGRSEGRLGASIFGIGISDDAKAPDVHVTYVSQGGLGMANRDYYLDARFADKKVLYQAYIANMLAMIGWDDPVGSAAAIVAFETRIAEAHWSPAQSRNRELTYNPATPAELAQQMPGFGWTAYLVAADLAQVDRLVVRQNTALPKIVTVFEETPMATLQAWQAFRVVDQAAPVLSQRFSDARWAFRDRDLSGTPEQRSRDKRAVSFAESGLGMALGRLYVAEYFPPESRAQMEALVVNLRIALAGRIAELDWMGPETREQALYKLDNFSVKIGYPDQWRDYSALQVTPGDLFGNREAIAAFNWAYQRDRLNRPVDPNEWFMTPQTVNATYNSTKNEITFPAGILQPPFFDPLADPAVNYGAIGGVIGHEIGHGFDDQGRKSDGDGILRDWWTAQDAANFDARAQTLGSQYAQYAPLPGFNIQPDLTMGENIGDLAGVTLGLAGYHLSLDGAEAPVLDGITGDQRVFYGWAQVWRSKARDETTKQLIATDSHSPAPFRVIGPLRNLDAWYDAFDVEPGDAYYLAPADRVRLW